MSEITAALTGIAIGATSKGLNKLAESLPSAFSAWWEPIQKVRMAKADAKSISIISEALRENIDMPVTYKDGTVEVISEDAKSLLDRSQNRFVYEQLQKQENIEISLNYAYDELENEDVVSDEPVEQDWMFRYFNLVQDITDDEMRKLWGKILAGEVKKPGTYSYRTMQSLQLMTKSDLEFLTHVFNFVIFSGQHKIICDNTTSFVNVNFSALDLNKMIDLGILSSNSLVKSFDNSKGIVAYSNNFILILNPSNDTKLKDFNFSFYNLTSLGMELYSLSPCNNDETLKQFSKLVHKKNNKYNLGLHKITCINNGKFKYDHTNILEQ